MSPDSRPATGFASVFTRPPPALDIAPDMRVGFILSPCFSLLPFSSFIESLRHAADEADFSRQIYCHWKIIGSTTEPITASCGVDVSPHEVFPDYTEFDYIVVVGGLLPESLEQPQETLAYLRPAYDAHISIVGLCTGSFILAPSTSIITTSLNNYFLFACLSLIKFLSMTMRLSLVPVVRLRLILPSH